MGIGFFIDFFGNTFRRFKWYVIILSLSILLFKLVNSQKISLVPDQIEFFSRIINLVGLGLVGLLTGYYLRFKRIKGYYLLYIILLALVLGFSTYGTTDTVPYDGTLHIFTLIIGFVAVVVSWLFFNRSLSYSDIGVREEMILVLQKLNYDSLGSIIYCDHDSLKREIGTRELLPHQEENSTEDEVEGWKSNIKSIIPWVDDALQFDFWDLTPEFYSKSELFQLKIKGPLIKRSSLHPGILELLANGLRYLRWHKWHIFILILFPLIHYLIYNQKLPVHIGFAPIVAYAGAVILGSFCSYTLRFRVYTRGGETELTGLGCGVLLAILFFGLGPWDNWEGLTAWEVAGWNPTTCVLIIFLPLFALSISSVIFRKEPITFEMIGIPRQLIHTLVHLRFTTLGALLECDNNDLLETIRRNKWSRETQDLTVEDIAGWKLKIKELIPGVENSVHFRNPIYVGSKQKS